MNVLDSARARKHTAMILARRRTTNMGGVAMDTSRVDRPAAAMWRFTLPCSAPIVPRPRISSRCLHQVQPCRCPSVQKMRGGGGAERGVRVGEGREVVGGGQQQGALAVALI